MCCKIGGYHTLQSQVFILYLYCFRSHVCILFHDSDSITAKTRKESASVITSCRMQEGSTHLPAKQGRLHFENCKQAAQKRSSDCLHCCRAERTCGTKLTSEAQRRRAGEGSAIGSLIAPSVCGLVSAGEESCGGSIAAVQRLQWRVRCRTACSIVLTSTYILYIIT